MGLVCVLQGSVDLTVVTNVLLENLALVVNKTVNVF